MGDGVNIAARLDAIAEPDTVCCRKMLVDRSRPQLKNIAEPIRIYSFEVGKPAKAEA